MTRDPKELAAKLRCAAEEYNVYRKALVSQGFTVRDGIEETSVNPGLDNLKVFWIRKSVTTQL